jgi:hypothetical protein
MSWKTNVGAADHALVYAEELHSHSLLAATLNDPVVRGFLGDGLINLLRARSEVHATLRAAGNQVPLAPTLPDALLPQRIPTIANGWEEDRVLAEIDQDGFAFATHEADEPFFNHRAERRARQQNLLDIVLFDGRVCIRKRFRGLKHHAVRWGGQQVPLRQRASRGIWTALRFFLYTEAAALLRLHDLPFVPKLRHIDFGDSALYIDCLGGESLRHRAARGGAAVHDKDLAAEAGLRGLPARVLDRREVDLLDRAGEGNFRAEIAAMAPEINRRGVVPLDIKLGNFVRGATTGRLYWLDFEVSRLQSQPRWEQDLMVQAEILEHLFRLDDQAARLPQQVEHPAAMTG